MKQLRSSIIPTFYFSLACALVLVVPSLRAETGDKIEKTFPVSAGGKLIVDSDLGSIEVRSGNASQVAVEVQRTVKARSEAREKEILNQHEFTFEKHGNDVLVRAKRKDADGRGWNLRNERYNVVFTIQVPREFSTDLKTSGGGIQVAELTGDVKTRTSGGGLKFTQIRGPIDGKTSGGGIKLDTCKGKVEIETSGGGIELSQCEGNVHGQTSGGSVHVTHCKGDFKVSSSGGGIHVEGLDGHIDGTTSGGSITADLISALSQDCHLETSGGGITVKIDEKAAFDLDAETSGGSVKTDLPVTVQGERRSRELRGKVNGGGKVLTLRTSGGSIHVKKL